MFFNNLQKGGRPLIFRQFTRKPWALFACLHREVLIGVLSVPTLACAAPRLMAANGGGALRPDDDRHTAQAAAEAEPDYAEADTLLLAEAGVTTARAPMAAHLAARPVTTLTRADLEAAGVSTVNDALKLTAGVDVRQRGGFGIQTDISIDGGTFDQITLLVNGIPIVNPQTGHNAADFPLNLSDIERIEILEGAASRVMGSQAFSGAINVVTRGAHEGSSPLEARVEGGSYGTVRTEARTAWSNARGWSVTGSGSWQRSDGTTENSAFKGGKGFAQIGWRSDAFRLDVQTGVTANDFGANTFYSAKYPDQWESTRRYLLSAKGESSGRIHLSPQVSWLRSTDHYQLVKDTETGENFNRSDVFTAGLNAWTQWRLGRTAAGAELREESLYSSNLGRPMQEEQYIGVPGHHGKLYTRHDDRTNISYFLEHNVVWRTLTVSAGVMAERNSAIDSKFRFYPGIDLSWRPAAAWKLYASWNKSLRLPTFTDLWYKSPTQEGNAGLRPEECSALRIAARYSGRVADVQLKAHFQHGKHMIDWVMYTPDDLYHATNFDLNTFGAGFDGTLRLQALLGKRQPLERITVSYAWLYQHRIEGQPYFKSNYAMEYLRHKFTARLSHRIAASLSAEWSLRVQQREGAYLVYRNAEDTGTLHPYGTYCLIDCRVQWKEKHYTLFADLTNLTARCYYDLGNVRQPGFLIMAGAALRI